MDPNNALAHQWTRFFPIAEDAASRDIDAHFFSRLALRQYLHDDGRVRVLYRSFGGGKVWTIVSGLKTMGDIVARECGWRDRAHMYSEPELHDAAAQENPHSATYLASLKLVPWEEMRRDFPSTAARLVHDTWGLPRTHARERWGWLRDDVTELFALNVLMALQGRAVMFAATPPRSAAPKIDVHFAPSSNESPDDARRRLKQLYAEADAALGPRERTRGTILDEARLARDVEWFYRNVLKDPREKVRPLARAYHDAAHTDGSATSTDHRSTVREGITRARRLLAEVPA